MGFGVVVEARDQGINVGVGRDLGRVEEEVSAPDQSRLLAQVDDALEEAFEGLDAQALADAGQTGVVGQGLVQRIPQVPAVGHVQARRLYQLALGADPLEEHDQLQLEEDHRVDAGAPCPA